MYAIPSLKLAITQSGEKAVGKVALAGTGSYHLALGHPRAIVSKTDILRHLVFPFKTAGTHLHMRHHTLEPSSYLFYFLEQGYNLFNTYLTYCYGKIDGNNTSTYSLPLSNHSTRQNLEA